MTNCKDTQFIFISKFIMKKFFYSAFPTPLQTSRPYCFIQPSGFHLPWPYPRRHFNDTSTIFQRYFNDLLWSKYGRCMVEVWSKYGRRAGEGRPLALWMRLFARFCRFIALCYSVLCQNCATGGAPALIFADFAPCYPCPAPL